MRNFIFFIRRFFNLILFLLLEVVCFILIARTNTLQGNDVLSSANTVVGLAYQKREDVVYYFRLKSMNESLLEENATLRRQLAERNYSVDFLKDSAATLAIQTKDSAQPVRYANYIYHMARVINNSVASNNNYITINRGSKDGIKKGSAVVSGTGIVGKVINVSGHFATVLSVISVKQKVSAHLKDGTEGSVIWEEGRPEILLMDDVPGEITVKKGDSVFTTRYSFFPPEHLIGTVAFKPLKNKKTGRQSLYLRSATNFRNMQYVYVVENAMTEEQKKLEADTK